MMDMTACSTRLATTWWKTKQKNTKNNGKALGVPVRTLDVHGAAITVRFREHLHKIKQRKFIFLVNSYH
jgi:hypothetical protein